MLYPVIRLVISALVPVPVFSDLRHDIAVSGVTVEPLFNRLEGQCEIKMALIWSNRVIFPFLSTIF